MRWFWLLPIGLVLWASAKSPCIVTDFYALSWISEPTLRHMELSRWLTTNGDNCKLLYYYARAREREGK